MRVSARRSLVLGLLFGVGGCAPPGRFVAPSMGMEPSDAVIVTGVGEAKGAPDVATLSLGVHKRGSDVEQVVSDANRALAAVVEALAACGVAPRDLQTSQVNVGLEEPPPGFYPYMAAPQPGPPPDASSPLEEPPAHRNAAPHGPPPPVASLEPGPFVPPEPSLPEPHSVAQVYSVSLSVTATVRELDRVGEVMAAAFTAGANQAYGAQLGWEDPKSWLDKARRAAVEDAKRRAKELARLGEVKLSRVLSIVEQSCGAGVAPQWIPYGVGPAMPMAPPMPGGAFERGEIAASCAVRVAFAIEP